MDSKAPVGGSANFQRAASPQHSTPPLSRSAHAPDKPTRTDRNTPSGTAMPSLSAIAPQHSNFPSVRTAHPYPDEIDTSTKAPPGILDSLPLRLVSFVLAPAPDLPAERQRARERRTDAHRLITPAISSRLLPTARNTQRDEQRQQRCPPQSQKSATQRLIQPKSEAHPKSPFQKASSFNEQVDHDHRQIHRRAQRCQPEGSQIPNIDILGATPSFVPISPTSKRRGNHHAYRIG